MVVAPLCPLKMRKARSLTGPACCDPALPASSGQRFRCLNTAREQLLVPAGSDTILGMEPGRMPPEPCWSDTGWACNRAVQVSCPHQQAPQLPLGRRGARCQQAVPPVGPHSSFTTCLCRAACSSWVGARAGDRRGRSGEEVVSPFAS